MRGAYSLGVFFLQIDFAESRRLVRYSSKHAECNVCSIKLEMKVTRLHGIRV